MEKDHKLSPKWRGPFPIIRIENPFQFIMKMEEKKRYAHVRHCKKFNSEAENVKKVYVIDNSDVIYDDSTKHPGEGPRDDKEAGDLLTPKGGVSTGDMGANMQKQRKRGRSFRCQSLPRRSRKMSFERIEVCSHGSVRAFMEIPSFVAWVKLHSRTISGHWQSGRKCQGWT